MITVNHPRVVVVKSQRKLHLFDGLRLIRTYPADLGSAPAGTKHLADDGRTPEGRFRVVSKNLASPNHRFLGLDYPDLNAAKWGFEHGLISAGELSGIEQALGQGGCPEWGTALGGGVGIHGGGRGTDWTAGCIALADRHVEELFRVLRIGDEVEILP
jgi:murein L,D-transpeptidase YafK